MPQDPFQTDPGYAQPGYQQPPPIAPPGYQQPPPGYHQPPPGYQAPPPYPPTLAYAPGPVPPAPAPAPARSGQGVVILVVAAVAILAIVAVGGVAAWVVMKSGALTTAGPSPSASTALSGAADPARGLVTGSGPVRVDVYVDYQCPPCSQFEEATGDVLAGYVASRRVTLSIHPVAFIDDRSKNRYATRAAAAMACAHEHGKGLEFHGYLLRHQPAEDTAGPTDEQLVNAGRALGLGGDFDACVSGRARVGWVGQATEAAQRYGVSSVPSVYVDDRSVQTTRSSLVTAIDNAR